MIFTVRAALLLAVEPSAETMSSVSTTDGTNKYYVSSALGPQESANR